MIGQNIAKIRKQRGITLSELAERTKISKSYLSNIERELNTNPTLEIILKISSVLNVDLITLVETGNAQDTHSYIEKEWADFIGEFKKMGLEKDQIQQYKPLIEFIKWQSEYRV